MQLKPLPLNNAIQAKYTTALFPNAQLFQFLSSDLFQTPREYEREYSKGILQKGVEPSKFHGFAYDGIWVIAKTLTRVRELLRAKQRQTSHHNFTIDDHEVGKMVLDVMNETNFYGVTVRIGYRYKHCVFHVETWI